jgi:hypothetical protein
VQFPEAQEASWFLVSKFQTFNDIISGSLESNVIKIITWIRGMDFPEVSVVL